MDPAGPLPLWTLLEGKSRLTDMCRTLPSLPMLCFVIELAMIHFGYRVGYELLLMNGLFIGLGLDGFETASGNEP